MLNQLHIGKRISQRFISDFGISFLHTLYGLTHRQLSGRGDFQPVIIYRNLYHPVIQIAAMYHRIDNQLTDGIRRNFIDILSINALKCCSEMNVPKDKLVRFLDLLPQRAVIFSPIHKNFFGSAFEYTTLRSNVKSTVASQNSKGVRWIVFSIPFNQNSPGTQLLSADILDGCLMFLTASILYSLFFHGRAKAVNLPIRDSQSSTQNLIEMTVTALK